MPLTGVWGQFPQYRGREGEVGTLEDRINGCMERSMNGPALALDGTEMKAFLAYMKWLSTGIPDGARLKGAGTLATKAPERAVDLAHGEQVYAADLRGLPRQGRPRQARRDRARLPVSAAVGTGQLQQRRRHDARAHRCRLRAAQHADRHDLRGARAQRQRRL